MKTLKLIIAGMILLVSNNTMQAQVSVNVNIGSPPAWGPVGYSSVDYYYLPDIEAYYDIRASQFIYFGRGKWIRSRNLPYHYRNYNLYNGYKVVLNDYHGSRPYNHFKSHKVKYYKGYKGKPQKARGHYKEEHRYEERHDNRRDDHNDRGHGKHQDKGNHGRGRD